MNLHKTRINLLTQLKPWRRGVTTACYKNSLKNSKGFSLAEVMIAVGMLGVMALASMSATNLLMKSTDYGDRWQSLSALANNIRQNLNYSDLCENAIGPTSGYNQNNIDLANAEIRVKIPNINSGATMTDDFVAAGQAILPLRLRIDSLKFTNLVNVAGTKYVGTLHLAASEIGGISHKPILISSIQFDLIGASPNMSIAKCIGVESGVSKTICQDMGCTWNAANPIKCDCLGPNGLCPVGELPVAVKQGVPDCRPLGGKACAANEYLVGVTIEKSICAPAF